jgi:hypothetical protein
MRPESIIRRSGYLLLLGLLLCVGLAACADDSGASTTRTPAALAQTPPPTPIPVSTSTLSCTIRSGEGEIEDATEQILTCNVSHMPTSDTSFALHYGIQDPAGQVIPLDPVCQGTLKEGSGTCTQTYEFVVAYPPVPGKVTGQSLPSHTNLGPVKPKLPNG